MCLTLGEGGLGDSLEQAGPAGLSARLQEGARGRPGSRCCEGGAEGQQIENSALPLTHWTWGKSSGLSEPQAVYL